VSADIRANTNLRIALRVTDPAESQDVIDVKGAALISRATPGRGFCRTGSGDVTQFQCARVGGPVSPVEQDPEVRVLAWEHLGSPSPGAAVAGGEGGATDLAHVVDLLRQAAASPDIPRARSPWLPPLPATIAAADLPQVQGSLALGLLDLPREQAQRAYALDLATGGHLLVAGGPGSGRTTLLRTLAGAVAATSDVRDVHLYGFDGATGGLLALAALPHTGAVVSRDELDRGDRLLTRLAAEVARRQLVLGRAGFASLAEQRAAARPADRLPWLLVLIDGWDGLVSAYDSVDSGRPVQTLLGLLREGAAVGLRAVVTGDRTVLTGRLSSLISDRLVLRMADPMDYAMAGLAPRQIPESMVPGRGLIPGDRPRPGRSGPGRRAGEAGRLGRRPRGRHLGRSSAVASGAAARTAGLWGGVLGARDERRPDVGAARRRRRRPDRGRRRSDLRRAGVPRLWPGPQRQVHRPDHDGPFVRRARDDGAGGRSTPLPRARRRRRPGPLLTGRLRLPGGSAGRRRRPARPRSR